jgi:hypothetical protein
MNLAHLIKIAVDARHSQSELADMNDTQFQQSMAARRKFQETFTPELVHGLLSKQTHTQLDGDHWYLAVMHKDCVYEMVLSRKELEESNNPAISIQGAATRAFHWVKQRLSQEEKAS